jgi:hypothetical protein
MLKGIQYRCSESARRCAFAVHQALSFVRLRAVQDGRKPDVTAVVVGRNDDYMPDFYRRLQVTVEWNLQSFVQEVVFVEWNPPADRPLLSIQLTKEFPQVRAYVVHPGLHKGLCDNPNLSLLEYHAKNVGIRRAEGGWIVAMNADVAISPDMLSVFHGLQLSGDSVFTAQRVDIPWREGRTRHLALFDCLHYRRIIPYESLGTGDFLLTSKELWHRVRGYDEALLTHRIGCDVRGAAQMRFYGASIQRAGTVLHFAHPSSCTEKVQPHHGDYASLDGLPYQNPPTWGMSNRREVQLTERVWSLE